MTTAREIMTEDAEFLKDDATAADAATRFAGRDIGAIPVCDAQGHLEGMVTDRDLVVKVLADGKDPSSTRLRDLTDQSEVVTVGADDDVDTIVRTMIDHKVRRLPVIDGDRLVGMVSQGDVAKHCAP
ncbi:MAG: signal transduction protein, partial [Acidimicrobiales bacterium]|nr:signal transduction protein [Acidimicrobiales bacterium]